MQTNLDFLAKYHPSWGLCGNERASFGDVSGFVEALGGRMAIDRMIEHQVNELLDGTRGERSYRLRKALAILIVWFRAMQTVIEIETARKAEEDRQLAMF